MFWLQRQRLGKPIVVCSRLAWGSVVGVVIFLVSWVVATPAYARPCHQTEQHHICLNQVKRSAKYYWQYRVSATVDGQPQPEIWYDCRDRAPTPLAEHPPDPTRSAIVDRVGELVCRLVKR